MNRRGVALVSTSHVVDDFYQGAVPALLPFLVAERHYTYAAIAGLTLAATVLSSVTQPLFGLWTDRRPRQWMIPAGLSTAAVGVALAGLSPTYLLTWLVIALSGLGIAAFHPEAARAARQAAGDSNRGMSIFAVGGNIGFALGSLVTTPVLLAFGVRGTALLIGPAAVMAVVLITRLHNVLQGRPGQRRVPRMPAGEDDWPAFLRLTSVVVVRSVVFYGLTSFLAVYFIHNLGASEQLGGTALTIFLVAGGVGTLLGGWLADRRGRLASIRVGLALSAPAMLGMLLVSDRLVALCLVALTGLALFMPFSVFVMLGQDYLPNRIGTASGVTVGLGVSIGGLFSPVLGLLADSAGLRTALGLLVILPLVALLLSFTMREATGAERIVESVSS